MTNECEWLRLQQSCHVTWPICISYSTSTVHAFMSYSVIIYELLTSHNWVFFTFFLSKSKQSLKVVEKRYRLFTLFISHFLILTCYNHPIFSTSYFFRTVFSTKKKYIFLKRHRNCHRYLRCHLTFT